MKTATVKQIQETMIDQYHEFDIIINNETIIDGMAVVMNLIERNQSKSFIVTIEDDAYVDFWQKWYWYIQTEKDRLSTIAAAMGVVYDPTADYKRTRAVTSNVETERTTTYGRKDTKTSTDTDTTTYGGVVTTDIVTFDSTLRDEQKITNSGSDGKTSTSNGSNTASGSDVTGEEGETTTNETITGSNSIAESMKKYVELQLSVDLFDLLLRGFENRYLYYGGGY